MAKSILSPGSGYIGSYDYTVNPYTGCRFGCTYCYVPTIVYHAQDAPSWGLAVTPKDDAPELLLRAAKSGKLDGKTIFLSPSTDPYVPQEKPLEVIRRLIEVFCAYPPRLLVVQTRSSLVCRDTDLFQRLGGKVVVGMSITTDRDDVRKTFEPRCEPIKTRVRALADLHDAGIVTQASLAPLLPCDPTALAELVSVHCNWAVTQALKMGQGARTWKPALNIVRAHGWQGWLEGGLEVAAAIQKLQELLRGRLHVGRAGFAYPTIAGPGSETG